MTEDEKEFALKAAEAAALVMPYVERGQLVPGFVQEDMRNLYGETNEKELVLGPMMACDVAIKYLSKVFLNNSLPAAAAETVLVIDRLKARDLAGFGQEAYADSSRATMLIVNAMLSTGQVEWSRELETAKRVVLAFNVMLLALIVRLAERYRQAPSWAATQLVKEITTVRPR